MTEREEQLRVAETLARLGVRLRVLGKTIEAMEIERLVQTLADQLAMSRSLAESLSGEGSGNDTSSWQSVAAAGTPDMGEVRGESSLADQLRKLFGATG